MARSLSFYALLAGSAAFYLLDPFVRISSRDFLPSDVFFIFSFLLLLFSGSGFNCFIRELAGNPGIGPFCIFLLAGFFGFLLTAMQRPVVQSFYFLSALQLAFAFFLLYPLVQAHKDGISKTVKLWSIHLWLIPFAGLLSVTDVLGLTNLGQDFGERHYNAILDTTFVNGFWLFALASPFLLQRLLPFRFASLWYGMLWLLGCAGAILSGSRAALGVVAVSIAFIALLNMRTLFRDRRMFAGFALFLVVIGGAGLMLQTFPVVFDRFQQAQDFLQMGKDDYSTSDRIDQVQIVFQDWMREPISLLGRGFKQYRVIHPEDPDESVHNIYLQQLYDTGIFGLIAFLIIFRRYFSEAIEFYRHARNHNDDDASRYWACCLFVVVAYLLLGLVHPIGYYRNFWLPLFLAVPSASQYRRLKRENAQTAQNLQLRKGELSITDAHSSLSTP